MCIRVGSIRIGLEGGCELLWHWASHVNSTVSQSGGRVGIFGWENVWQRSANRYMFSIMVLVVCWALMIGGLD